MAAPARTLPSRIERRLPRIVRDAVRGARREDLLLLSAGLAFYALVSVLPLTIVALWLSAVIAGGEHVRALADALRTMGPRDAGLTRIVEQTAQAGLGLGITALVTGLWPASSYGAGLVRAFDRVSSRPARRLKGLRGRALTLVVLLPLFVVGSLATSLIGSNLLGEGAAGRALGIALALLVGFVGAAAAIALIYVVFPPERLGARSIAAATLLTAAGVSVLSLVLTVYLNVGANFREHYAASTIGTVVLLAVWLFLANALLLVGYQVAQSVERR